MPGMWEGEVFCLRDPGIQHHSKALSCALLHKDTLCSLDWVQGVCILGSSDIFRGKNWHSSAHSSGSHRAMTGLQHEHTNFHSSLGFQKSHDSHAGAHPVEATSAPTQIAGGCNIHNNRACFLRLQSIRIRRGG